MKKNIQDLAQIMDKMGMKEIILFMNNDKQKEFYDSLNDFFPNGSVTYTSKEEVAAVSNPQYNSVSMYGKTFHIRISST